MLVYDRPDILTVYLENLPWKRGYITLHKAKGEGKTNEQLSYYYAVVVETAFRQMQDDGNDVMKIEIGEKTKTVPLTRDVVDIILKDAYAKSIGSNKVLKRNMSLADCMALIDFAIRWCAIYLHCVIPEPDPLWKQKGAVDNNVNAS
jgi:hypothetical protein